MKSRSGIDTFFSTLAVVVLTLFFGALTVVGVAVAGILLIEAAVNW